MAENLQIVISSVQTANEILSHQITQALITAEFITASEEEDVLTILMAGSTKVGDWLQLLERNVHFDSTPTATNHAPTHSSA